MTQLSKFPFDCLQSWKTVFLKIDDTQVPFHRTSRNRHAYTHVLNDFNEVTSVIYLATVKCDSSSQTVPTVENLTYIYVFRFLMISDKIIFYVGY